MIFPRFLLFVFASFLIGAILNQYFFCPVYSFKKTEPFSGTQLYNPYDSIKDQNWIKCNFHTHSTDWHGFTNGNGNAAIVSHYYEQLGYKVHCLSNYQDIDKTFSKTPGYISAYEHGYGIRKTHQLVLGSDHVCWLDYPFPQSLSNKQNILNHLKEAGNVVVINHPLLRNAYSPSDFEYLTNYDCIEVLNPRVISTACWDSALSSGKPVFIVGNDDVHNVFKGDHIGSMCTWVNAATIQKDSILNALKHGKDFGEIVGDNQNKYSLLKNFILSHDTISIETNQPAQEISFIGQGGRLLSSSSNISAAAYQIKPADHYVRTEILFANGAHIYLNPVFWYEKNRNYKSIAPINKIGTALLILLGLILSFLWLRFAFPFFISKKGKQQIRELIYSLPIFHKFPAAE